MVLFYYSIRFLISKLVQNNNNKNNVITHIPKHLKIRPNVYGSLYLYFIYKVLKQLYSNKKAHKKTYITASKYLK